MLERYRMYRRNSVYYAKDKVTGKSESLKTNDKAAARQLLVAMNQAVAQPQLNRSLAKAYLSAKSPELLTRTWADVMHHYVVTGVESTRDRKERCFRSRPFAIPPVHRYRGRLQDLSEGVCPVREYGPAIDHGELPLFAWLFG